ncbi:SRPBCC domain-containing protein [Streptomyces sp. NBC_00249]|uniref:SRPBCC domain-containing protein n=1 Tax=Streptomyces sp. NBC_00249 TaxID=2975690 RepID=UPI002254F7B7|nr:SRPBCC domain-containing protein [Streptomyces sp. NBC_00249]MCX5198560.1 SRPBCC domain-containing protein [Streptomyces sp. NBC_00249]
MRTTATEITVDATPAQVWATLTDLPRYCTWNPVVRQAAGEVAVGARLELTMYAESGKPTVFRPTVLTAVPGAELRWAGRFLVRGLLDTEHWFRLSEGPGRTTRLEHGERFRGLLAPLLGSRLTGTARNFTPMNEALRTRVESARSAL